MGVLSVTNALILSFLIAEAVRTIFFTKEWKYRFRKSLKPIEDWKKGLIIMVLFLLFFPFINWLFVNYVSILLDYLGWYQFSLLLVLLPGSYLWIEKRILNLSWNWKDAIPIGIIVLVIAISFIF